MLIESINGRRHLSYLWIVLVFIFFHGLTNAYAGLCENLLVMMDDSRYIFRLEIQTPGKWHTREAELIDVRQKIREFAERRGIKLEPNSDVEFQISFIVSESIRNAAYWGNKNDPKKKIWVNVSADDTGVYIQVRDQGEAPFDPLNNPFVFVEGNEAHDRFVAEKRKRVGKDKLGEGLFWSSILESGIGFHYQFNHGSQVTFQIPWTYVDKNKIRKPAVIHPVIHHSK